MSKRRLAFGVVLALVLLTIIVGVSKQARAAAVCTPTSTVSGPYARDGAGDACFQTANLCSFINSWNMTTLEVNGTAYTNQYVASNAIAPLNGMYVVHYVGAYPWSHFEFGGTCSSTPPPTTPPPTTPPPTTPPPTTPPPTTPPPTTPPPTTQPGQAPYGGTPWAIPGTIQAENYDTGGEGVAYHDTTSGNSGNAYRTDAVDIEATTDTGGGNNVGWTAAGEWLEYTVNVASTGTYTLNARVSSQSGGGSIHVEFDSVNVTGTMTIPSTGGWQTWTTVTKTGLSLSSGRHVMRIAEDAAGFNLNWVSLTSGTPPPTTPPPTTPPPTTPPPTTPPPTTPPPTTPPPTTPPPGTHLDNPFVNATFYRNVDYVASVNAAADLTGGTLGTKMRLVANYPTFVWLDSIDAVNGTNGYSRSLAGHLDQALAQGANAIGIVVYDLPNRDCSALASNGELLIAQNGLNRYKTEYIDVIFNTIRQSKYSGLRVVMIIEPDSLPNLITNLSGFAKCQEAGSPSIATGAYAQGVQYAIGTLRSITNTYAYIDVGHHAWLGWPNNRTPFVQLLKDVGNGIPGGIGKVDGFIGGTANYAPTDEPYMDANTMIGGNPVRSLQGWYDWNDFIDEQPYLTTLRNELTSGGNPYPTSIGMLIDTSRNGWGGPNRPTGPSPSTDLKTFVMASRIDRRIHKGNWCNQSGAGIGERPRALTTAGFDAYVWVKPPGESDGSSSLIPTGPDNPGGKGFDRMCDPTYTGNSLNGNNLSGALPNAPVSGRWFQAQFQELVSNAFPPF